MSRWRACSKDKDAKQTGGVVDEKMSCDAWRNVGMNSKINVILMFPTIWWKSEING